MSEQRNNCRHAVYVMRGCKTCGVTDLGNFKHEKDCSTLDAQIERGERLSDGEVLEQIITEWRMTHADTKIP